MLTGFRSACYRLWRSPGRRPGLGGAGIFLLCLGGGCLAVTQRPPLPQAGDFARPKAEIYAKYPDLRDYDVSPMPWARELYLDVPHVVKNWGPPARQAMSWWTLGGLFIRPAYWYWWDKGRYQVGLYYEKHLINGWQPVGVRVELRENTVQKRK